MNSSPAAISKSESAQKRHESGTLDRTSIPPPPTPVRRRRYRYRKYWDLVEIKLGFLPSYDPPGYQPFFAPSEFKIFFDALLQTICFASLMAFLVEGFNNPLDHAHCDSLVVSFERMIDCSNYDRGMFVRVFMQFLIGIAFSLFSYVTSKYTLHFSFNAFMRNRRLIWLLMFCHVFKDIRAHLYSSYRTILQMFLFNMFYKSYFYPEARRFYIDLWTMICRPMIDAFTYSHSLIMQAASIEYAKTLGMRTSLFMVRRRVLQSLASTRKPDVVLRALLGYCVLYVAILAAFLPSNHFLIDFFVFWMLCLISVPSCYLFVLLLFEFYTRIMRFVPPTFVRRMRLFFDKKTNDEIDTAIEKSLSRRARRQRKRRRESPPVGGRMRPQSAENVDISKVVDKVSREMILLTALQTSICESSSRLGVVAAIVSYIQAHSEKSLISQVLSLRHSTMSGDTLFQDIDSNVSNFVGQSGLSEKAWLDTLKESIRSWQDVKKSANARNLLKLVNFAVAMGLCHASTLSFNVGKMKLFEPLVFDRQVSCTNFVEILAETCIGFVEGGWRLFSTGKLSSFFIEKDVSKFEDLYAKICDIHGFALTGNLLRETGIEDGQYEPDYLEPAILSAEKFLARIPKQDRFGPEGRFISDRLERLREWRNQFIQVRVRGGLRKAPFAISLYGGTGVGKSSLNSLTYKTIGKYNNFSVADERVSVWADNDKYASNIRSSTNVVIFDDMCNTKPAHMDFSPCYRIIQTINNALFLAPMADVFMKGKVALRPWLVMVTTNKENLDANLYSNKPESILRRLFHVTVEIKDEFAEDGRLCSAKVYEAFGKVQDPDIWKLTVKTCCVYDSASENSSWELVPITFEGKVMKDVGVSEYLRWAQLTSKRHYAEQEDLLDTFKNEECLSFCEKCKVYACGCNRPKEPVELETIYELPLEVEPGESFVHSFGLNLYPDNPDPDGGDVVPVTDVEYSNAPTCAEKPVPVSDPRGDEIVERTWNENSGRKVKSWGLKRHRFHKACYIDTPNEIWYVPKNGKSRMSPRVIDKVLKGQSGEEPDMPFFDGANPTEAYGVRVEPATIAWTHMAKSRYTKWQRLKMLCSYYTSIQVERIQALFGDYDTPTLVETNSEFVERRFYSWVTWLPAFLIENPLFVLFVMWTQRGSIIRRSKLMLCLLAIVVYVVTILHYHGMKWTSMFTVFFSWVYIATYLRLEYNAIRASLLDRRDVYPAHVRRFKRISRIIFCGSILAFGFYSIRRLIAFNTMMMKPQGNIIPTSDEEVQERSRERDQWAWVARTRTELSTASKTTDVQDIMHKIKHATIRASVNDGKLYTNGFIMETGLVCFPSHFLDENVNRYGPEFTINCNRTRSEQLGGNFIIRYSSIYRYDIEGTDISVVWAPSSGSSYGHSKFLPLSFPGRQHVMFVDKDLEREPGDEVRIYDTMAEPALRGLTYTNGGTIDRDGVPGSHYELPIHTRPGMCMAPVVGVTFGTYLYGFHICGDGHKGGCAYISRPQFLAAKKHLESLPGSVPLTERVQFKPQYGQDLCTDEEIHPKSAVNFMEPGSTLEVFGPTLGRTTPKSAVAPTIISDAVAEVTGVENKWGPPKMKGPGVYPFQKTLQLLAKPAIPLGACFVKAVSSYTSSMVAISRQLHKTFSETRPLTNIENLNGVPGVKFLDAMKLSTSPGFPLSGPKRNLTVEAEPTDDYANPVDFSPEVWEEVNRMEESLRKGERCWAVWKACLKDEPTKLTKDKVRVFQSAPVALQILLRRYFLPIARLIQTVPTVSECAVGVNCEGPEWDQLHDFTVSKGKNVLAGDYSNYDTRITSQCVIGAFDVLISIAEKCCDYTEEDLHMMRMLVSEVAYPLMAYNGDLVLIFGSNPSGNNLTAVLNSIINVLLLRSLFYTAYPDASEEDFRKAVAAMTYGDDLKGTVDEGFPEVNHIAFAEFLKKHDMVFTMPDKTSTPTTYMTDEDADFLKRTHYVSEDLGIGVGVLDEDSIFKRLHCAIQSSEMTSVEQAAANIDASLYDWFYHGRTIYEMRRGQMKEVAARTNLSQVCLTLDQNYDFRLQQWRQKYDPSVMRANESASGS